MRKDRLSWYKQELFLKDCEWRFNNSDPERQLSQIEQWVRDNIGSLSGTFYMTRDSVYKSWGTSVSQHCR